MAEVSKKRIWLKVSLWVVFTPVMLFVLLMALLYVPPVQDFIRRKATAMASEATGMQIGVERIDLRFPLNLLVRGVSVVQPADSTSLPVAPPDTLLALGSLNVHVQAWPLLRGQVEVDGIAVNNVAVNSAGLIDGMSLKGTLGSFFLQSHGIDLARETVVLNNVELADTHLQLALADTTTAPPDTTSTALAWKVRLHSLRLRNVSVGLDMPLDTLHLAARVGQADVDEAFADLGRQDYRLDKFLLTKTSVAYDAGVATPSASGFDPSHLLLRDVHVAVDSVRYCGRDMNAVIRELTLNEHSGLSVVSLTGQLSSDSTLIRVPSLRLLTPHSELNLTAQTYWELVEMPTTGRLTARLDARIGKQDVLLFASDLPDSFKEAYPPHPFVLRAGTEGNLRQMQLSGFSAQLPGAFSMRGTGNFYNVDDSLKRSGNMDLEMRTYDLNFLTALTGDKPGSWLAVPDSMDLMAHMGLKGSECTATLNVREQDGTLDLAALYDLSKERYHAKLDINDLQLHRFLPHDSIYALTATLSLKGEGTDFASPHTRAEAHLSLGMLQDARWTVTDVGLDANLKSSTATVDLRSDNYLLKMDGSASLRLDRPYTDAKAVLHVDEVALHELGLLSQPLQEPLAFTLNAEARHNAVDVKLLAGDMDLDFHARGALERLMERSEHFATLLAGQMEARRFDHAALRRALPTANMRLTAGKRNPANYYLATQGMAFEGMRVDFGFSPRRGINGRAVIHTLRSDSLQLDTVFFAVRQDTTGMRLQGGVVNGPANPQFVFRSTVTGEIRNKDAELTLNFVDGQGRTGLLLGVNATPLTEGHGKGKGLLVQMIPENPVIAFRNFHFADKRNWIYLHDNMRVYAGIDMVGEDGMAFRMNSNRADTVSLQNINVELSRFRLDELGEIMPYLPRLTGLFSAEANYVQTASSLQLSADVGVEQLTYERKPVGDIGLGLSWLPEGEKSHYVGAYLSYNDNEVVTVDGLFSQRGEKNLLDLEAAIAHLPLEMANAFVPDGMVTLSGDMDGTLALKGSSEKPDIRGEVRLDTVSVFVRQMGARYWLDSRPLVLEDGRLLFNKFSIYTTSRNPFVIDGYVDYSDINRMMADLTLHASRYTLLDAPRTRESLVYGKVDVDINAAVRGPVDALTMRGSMSLLGTTNVTYVLTDSPLTVEDRLSGLVTFTSFADTLNTDTMEIAAMPLGGMEMYLSVHIDDAVRLRADLSPDRSKFIELEGGGDLNLQYTRQGDMNLTGRYTLSGGVMKYSLPIIPLKEFTINSGSYVDWRGDIMNPMLNLKATERMRASVAEGDGDASRMVNFDVSIAIKNRLEAPDLVFDITAPEDATVENELQSMGAEERSKQAIAMLATGIYLNSGAKGGGLTMGAALNSVLQSQINALAGSVKGASISVGVEDRTSSETGDKQTDYSFRYSQRFFNDRFQIVIGGKVSTGANATNDAESFIDNISLEYRLDTSGTRYVRVFHNKNYESVLDGEITETGVGLVLRRKMDRLGELFIFKRKRKQEPQASGSSRAETKQAGDKEKEL